MNQFRRSPGLPLLIKELVELAARKRTYIIRVAYVTLFFLASASVIVPIISSRGKTPLGMLGVGREIFTCFVGWQFAGIYLFLPALACGSITNEKERNTLGLLFLTRLGPWTIVWEKLLSRLIPMLCLLLCSLPLMAFSISLGGVNLIDMFSAFWFLSLTAFQVGAISTVCSSFFRTTPIALLSCYALLFLVSFGLPLGDWLLLDNTLREEINEIIRIRFPSAMVMANYGELILLMFFGPILFVVSTEQRMLPGNGVVLQLCGGIPLILSALFPIALARLFLIQRAFLSPTNLVMNVLRQIDRLFKFLNNNPLTRGIILIDESQSEPIFAPIAWRETNKRSLGRTAYLIRILLLLEIPVLLLILLTVFRSVDDGNSMSGAINFMTVIMWIMAALLMIVTASGLIAGERGRQTMDILLTIPMSGRQIILDKVAGARRLNMVCAVPLLTCIGFEAWWRDVARHNNQFYLSYGQNFIWWDYLITATSMVLIYLPLLCWVSLWIGLKTKSATRATVTALMVVVGWCVAPIVACVIFWSLWIGPYGWGSEPDSFSSLMLLLSPAGLIAHSEVEGAFFLSRIPLLPMFVNTAIYGVCLLIVRSHVLRNADNLLGRAKPLTERANLLRKLNFFPQPKPAPSVVD